MTACPSTNNPSLLFKTLLLLGYPLTSGSLIFLFFSSLLLVLVVVGVCRAPAGPGPSLGLEELAPRAPPCAHSPPHLLLLLPLSIAYFLGLLLVVVMPLRGLDRTITPVLISWGSGGLEVWRSLL